MEAKPDFAHTHSSNQPVEEDDSDETMIDMEAPSFADMDKDPDPPQKTNLGETAPQSGLDEIDSESSLAEEGEVEPEPVEEEPEPVEEEPEPVEEEPEPVEEEPEQADNEPEQADGDPEQVDAEQPEPQTYQEAVDTAVAIGAFTEEPEIDDADLTALDMPAPDYLKLRQQRAVEEKAREITQKVQTARKALLPTMPEHQPEDPFERHGIARLTALVMLIGIAFWLAPTTQIDRSRVARPNPESVWSHPLPIAGNSTTRPSAKQLWTGHATGDLRAAWVPSKVEQVQPISATGILPQGGEGPTKTEASSPAPVKEQENIGLEAQSPCHAACKNLLSLWNHKYATEPTDGSFLKDQASCEENCSSWSGGTNCIASAKTLSAAIACEANIALPIAEPGQLFKGLAACELAGQERTQELNACIATGICQELHLDITLDQNTPISLPENLAMGDNLAKLGLLMEVQSDNLKNDAQCGAALLREVAGKGEYGRPNLYAHLSLELNGKVSQEKSRIAGRVRSRSDLKEMRTQIAQGTRICFPAAGTHSEGGIETLEALRTGKLPSISATVEEKRAYFDGREFDFGNIQSLDCSVVLKKLWIMGLLLVLQLKVRFCWLK